MDALSLKVIAGIVTLTIIAGLVIFFLIIPNLPTRKKRKTAGDGKTKAAETGCDETPSTTGKSRRMHWSLGAVIGAVAFAAVLLVGYKRAGNMAEADYRTDWTDRNTRIALTNNQDEYVPAEMVLASNRKMRDPWKDSLGVYLVTLPDFDFATLTIKPADKNWKGTIVYRLIYPNGGARSRELHYWEASKGCLTSANIDHGAQSMQIGILAQNATEGGMNFIFHVTPIRR